MFGYVVAPEPYRLTRAMARTAGVNLPAAVVDGWLRRDELADLLRRCAGCGRSRACTGRRATVGTGAMPDYCCLKPDLEALSPG